MTNKILKKIGRGIAQRRRRVLSIRRNQLSLWIGRLVIAFNDLDLRISQAVTKELGSSDIETADMILASMSFGQRVDLLTALLLRRYRDNATQQEHVRTVAAALSAAEEFRNLIVHSLWLNRIFIGECYERRKAKTKGRKGLKVVHEKADVPRIKSAIDDIYALHGLGVVSAASEKVAAALNRDIFKHIIKRLKEP